MRGGDPGSRSPYGSREGLGLTMSNVVPFPTSRRVKVKAIPREEFEQLAELALDVVERIVALLDDRDRGPPAQAGDRGFQLDNLHSRQAQTDYRGLEME
jgi:hypothetical protein